MRFADTSFWFSLQERRDRHHAEARALVTQGMGRVVVSNHVLGETWTLMRRRGGHSAAIGFLDRVNALPEVEVVHIDARVEADAWRWHSMVISVPPASPRFVPAHSEEPGPRQPMLSCLPRAGPRRRGARRLSAVRRISLTRLSYSATPLTSAALHISRTAVSSW